MRTMILTLVAVLCSACGWQAPFDPAKTCDFGQGFGPWHTQKDRGCDFYKTEAEAARDQLLAQGFVRSDQIQAVIAVDVWIHDDTYEIVCQGQIGQAGCYEFGGAIETTTGGGEVFHEYLHRLDELEGVSEEASAAHTGWKESGRWDAGNRFQGYWNAEAQEVFHLFGDGCDLAKYKADPLCAGYNERAGVGPVD